MTASSACRRLRSPSRSWRPMAFCCATKAAAKPLAPRAWLGLAFGFHLVVRVSVRLGLGLGQLGAPPRLLVGLARPLHPLAQPRLLLLPRLLLQLERRRELSPLRAHLGHGVAVE